MKVDMSEIISGENVEMSQCVEIEFTTFDAGMGKFPVWKKVPFVLSASTAGGKLHITGETEVVIGIPCDRCLEDVPITFFIEISREIDLEKLAAKDSEALEDTGYMTGTNLDVDKLIFGEILVRWPMKVLCREDCKGICKRCGANQNLAECQCQKTEPDPRMAAIQDIFNQFKEV